jgi:hypothetical protein
MIRIYSLILSVVFLAGCSVKETSDQEEWIQLFNGKDLQGWTPKITGYASGNNFRNTFRVEDGLLKVSYSEYDSFRGEFGHLFYKDSFSHYRLRLQYRFTGDQLPGGPSWARMNSGIMVHGQSPESMNLDQDFPVCLEAQFLAGAPDWVRPTGNLCTPGTHVYLADTLTTTHCINSFSKTYLSDQWVTAEIITYGDSIIHHVIEGDTVFTFTKPRIGGELPAGYPVPEGTPVTGGFFALQSESHPVEFRNIEILDLSRKK